MLCSYFMSGVYNHLKGMATFKSDKKLARDPTNQCLRPRLQYQFYRELILDNKRMDLIAKWIRAPFSQKETSIFTKAFIQFVKWGEANLQKLPITGRSDGTTYSQQSLQLRPPPQIPFFLAPPIYSQPHLLPCPQNAITQVKDALTVINISVLNESKILK